MIREQRGIENRQLPPADLGASNSAQSTPVVAAREEKPQARGIDVLKSRIEQLAQEELEQQKKQPAPDLVSLTEPEEKQMLTEAQARWQPATGQGTGEPKEVPSGTISVQDLVKKRDQSSR